MTIRNVNRKKNTNTVPWGYAYDDLPKDMDGIIYVRQSTEYQRENNIHSFEMQTEKFIEHFRDMGYIGHIEVIADDEAGKTSGTLDIHKRPGLSRVTRIVEEEGGKRVGWIGTVHVNRLTRDPWMLTPAHLMKLCYEHNVWIITLRMPFNFKDEYCQQVFMLEAQESAKHLKWMKLVLGGALSAASDKGYYDGRFLSPGYIVDRSHPLQKKYIVYEPHAEVVRWLFRRYFELDGDFPALKQEIVNLPFLFPAFESWVDRKNIGKFLVKRIKEGPYAGNYTPSERGLRSILTNPVYIGWWLPLDGGCIENNHEAVIDEELFVYAHKRLSTHTLSGERQKPALIRSHNTEALLKKVIFDAKANPVYTKQCRGKTYYTACTYDSLTREYETSILVRTLDAIFLEKFLERVQTIDPDRFSDWEDWIEQRQQERQSREKTIKRLIEEARKQRQATMDILADPEVPKTKQMKIEYAAKIAGLEEKIAALQKDLGETPSNEEEEQQQTLYEISTLVPRIVELWPKLSFQKRMRFVGSLVTCATLQIVAPSWIELQIEWKMQGWDTDVAYVKASNGASKPWSEEEEEILRQLYPTERVETILQALPARTWSGILTHTPQLGISRINKLRSPLGTRITDHPAEADRKFMEAHGIAISEKVHWGKRWYG